MKSTGIIRRIDDLGRVMIPKEIQRVLRIQEGDPVEIYTDKEGSVVLKKYSPLGELNEFAEDYAEITSELLGCAVIVTDTDQIIAVAGAPKKELLGKTIGKEVKTAIYEKIISNDSSSKHGDGIISEPVSIVGYQSRVIVPIVYQGDSIGSVIVMKREGYCGDVEEKIAEIGAYLLSRKADKL